MRAWRVLAIPWWDDETFWCIGVLPGEDLARVFDSRVGSGTTREIIAIADAIDSGEDEQFKRCAVRHLERGRVHLWVPRDPEEFSVIVPIDEAKALAREIRRVVEAERTAA